MWSPVHHLLTRIRSWPMDQERYEERVLAAVELVPPGRVITYGLIAEYLEQGGPRQVARVMAHSGGSVPWWRVVRADGSLPAALAARARPEYLSEATPLKAGGQVDIARAVWWPGQDMTTQGSEPGLM